MSVKVTDNTQLVMAKIDKGSVVFIRKAMDRVVRYSTPKTPMSRGKRTSGSLRRRVGKTMSGKQGIIQWEQPYAIYQEKKKYKNYTTSGTGPHYAENAIAKVVKETQLVANEAFAI